MCCSMLSKFIVYGFTEQIYRANEVCISTEYNCIYYERESQEETTTFDKKVVVYLYNENHAVVA